MKKFLYGTTALVAAGMLASPAMAAEKIQLKLGGFMQQWMGFASQDSSWETANGTRYANFDQQSDSEVYFTGATKLDNGITVSVVFQLEGDESVGAIDETYLKLTSDMIGDLRIGGRKAGDWAFGFFAPEVSGFDFDSGDVDNWILVPSGFTYSDTTRSSQVADRNGIIYYTPRFGGFGLFGSFHPNISNNTQGGGIQESKSAGNQEYHQVGAVFERDFNGVGIKADFAWGQRTGAESASDFNEWKVGTVVSFGGFSVGGAYRQINDSATSTSNVTSTDGYVWNAGVSYATGPFAVSVAYMESNMEGSTATPDNDEMNMAQLGLKYTLGPGVDLAGSLFWAEYDNEVTTAANNNEGIGGVVGINLGF